MTLCIVVRLELPIGLTELTVLLFEVLDSELVLVYAAFFRSVVGASRTCSDGVGQPRYNVVCVLTTIDRPFCIKSDYLGY